MEDKNSPIHVRKEMVASVASTGAAAEESDDGVPRGSTLDEALDMLGFPLTSDGRMQLVTEDLDRLCSFVDEERSSKEQRLEVLRLLGSRRAKVFSCAQFSRLLKALEIKSERLIAVESIAPRIIDPQNAQAEILQFFRFAEEVSVVLRLHILQCYSVPFSSLVLTRRPIPYFSFLV